MTTLTMIAALTATGADAHPPDETDHGVNQTTFHTLWAGDVDDATGNVSADRAAMETLANRTDIPLNTPPQAVARWNRGDLEDFPNTDRERSIHPSEATLEDGTFIKDAYAAIFAVQPSTRAHISSSNQSLYVASDGRVLGTVDYRIVVPDDDTDEDRQVFWTLRSHHIVETRLVVDSQVEQSAAGTHTPSIEYSSLGSYPGDRHTLRLTAEIEVAFEKRVRTAERHCWNAGDSTKCSTSWDEEYVYPIETVTVEDSIDVTEYDLNVSGFRARYPNGDLGLVVYKNRPWLGYSLPTGDVHGVWRFYSARDPAWETLVTSTASGTTANHSPLHPLQVNAYPIEPGPTASPRRTVTILEVYGNETMPPTLPSDVHLDVLAEPYVASYGIATRTRTTTHDLSAVTAYGLVRGVSVSARDEPFVDVPINQSELALDIVNATDETVTVRIQLTDANTGAPIDTSSREGYVVLDGERVNTSENGSVTETLPRSVGGISARYEPGRWWYDIPGYVGDSDVVYVRGTVLQTLSTLYRLFVPVSLFLLSVFVIDRITGWRIWPPWRWM